MARKCVSTLAADSRACRSPIVRSDACADGINVMNLSADQRGALFSVQFQDYTRLEMRYADNIDITYPDMNISRIKRFIRSIDPSESAVLDEAVLGTNVGSWFEDSLQLSGGQWQRLAIYRALYKSAGGFICLTSRHLRLMNRQHEMCWR